MKWCLVFLLFVMCYAAQGTLEHKLHIVNLTGVNITDNTNTRIIGGTSTSIERFPYAVQVQYNRRLACGGSLITRRHVMTAAHCFFDANGNAVSSSRYTIRAGTANLQSGGTVYSVSTVIIHERYDTPFRDNDVAVMVLASTVRLSNSVAIAGIPAQGYEVPDNSVVVAVGWGRTNVNSNQASPVLQEVTIRTISFRICSERYNWLSTITPSGVYIITNNMICSGLLDVGGADACQGDSGGPLVFQGAVVGITSWGYDCGHPQFPGVNAKVSAYTNWINQTVTMYNASPPAGSTSFILLSISFLITSIFAR